MGKCTWGKPPARHSTGGKEKRRQQKASVQVGGVKAVASSDADFVAATLACDAPSECCPFSGAGSA